jgi:hypothetical protein
MGKKQLILMAGVAGLITMTVFLSGNKILSYAKRFLGIYEEGNNQGWDNAKFQKLMR